MAKEKLLPKAEDFKLDGEMIQVLAELNDTHYYRILKRVVRGYTESMKNQVFALLPQDEQLAIKLTAYKEQAVGMGILLKVIEDAKKKLDEADEA